MGQIRLLFIRLQAWRLFGSFKNFKSFKSFKLQKTRTRRKNQRTKSVRSSYILWATCPMVIDLSSFHGCVLFHGFTIIFEPVAKSQPSSQPPPQSSSRRPARNKIHLVVDMTPSKIIQPYSSPSPLQSFDRCCLACSQLSRCFSTPPSLYGIDQSISPSFVDYIWELIPAHITMNYYMTSSCSEKTVNYHGTSSSDNCG